MNYENTLEKVIIRLDEEDKEKDKRIAELKELIELTGSQYNASRTAFMNQEVMFKKRIAELEKENKELQECFDGCYEELRLTRDAVEFAPRSCEPKEQE